MMTPTPTPVPIPLPDPNTFHFWWDWWVNVAVAVGTISAVAVALFGQAFRAKFFPPRLTLRILNAEGELTTAVNLQTGASARTRYYHMRTENSRRWSPANGVQVMLLQVMEPGPDEQLQMVWQGELPFGWRHQIISPLAKTIGGGGDIDLCSVEESGRLTIHLLLSPNNLSTIRTGRTQLVLLVQARGHEGDSPVVRVRIAWDGRWNAGAAEMRRHLVVEELHTDA